LGKNIINNLFRPTITSVKGKAQLARYSSQDRLIEND